MIDLQACPEAYQESAIDNIGLVKSWNNVADGRTKLNKAEVVEQVMRTGNLQAVAYQWIVRSEGGMKTDK